MRIATAAGLSIGAVITLDGLRTIAAPTLTSVIPLYSDAELAHLRAQPARPPLPRSRSITWCGRLGLVTGAWADARYPR